MMMVKMTSEMKKCMDDCMSCHQMGMQTMTYCMMMGGKYMEGPMMMLRDCAMMCQTCADFMINGSDMHMKVCALCMEMCMRCAEECEKMPDDAQMMACAKMMRECCASCQMMMA